MKIFEFKPAYVTELFIGIQHAHRIYKPKTSSESAWSKATIWLSERKKIFYIEKEDEKTTPLSGKCSISLSFFVWYWNFANVPKSTILGKNICITHQTNTYSKSIMKTLEESVKYVQS